MTKITYIPGEIANAAIDGNGKRKPVTRTQHIFDDALNKPQSQINAELNDAILEEKTYSPADYSGMGRKILRKNIVDGINTLTQSMINQPNTIYIIQYDFTLGEDITIPEGCVLEFDGGSLSNGTIVGNDTVIESPNISIFNNIIFDGTFNNPFKVEWFKQAGDGDDDSYAFNRALSVACINHVVAKSSQYTIEHPIVISNKNKFIFDAPTVFNVKKGINCFEFLGWNQNVIFNVDSIITETPPPLPDQSQYPYTRLDYSYCQASALLIRANSCYNSEIIINAILYFKYGIDIKTKYNEEACGFQYNKINFMTINCHTGIYLDLVNGSDGWITESQFFGGRIIGVYGLLSTESEDDLSNELVFHNIGFEHIDYPIDLTNVNYSRIYNPRIAESIYAGRVEGKVISLKHIKYFYIKSGSYLDYTVFDIDDVKDSIIETDSTKYMLEKYAGGLISEHHADPENIEYDQYITDLQNSQNCIKIDYTDKVNDIVVNITDLLKKGSGKSLRMTCPNFIELMSYKNVTIEINDDFYADSKHIVINNVEWSDKKTLNHNSLIAINIKGTGKVYFKNKWGSILGPYSLGLIYLGFDGGGLPIVTNASMSFKEVFASISEVNTLDSNTLMHVYGSAAGTTRIDVSNTGGYSLIVKNEGFPMTVRYRIGNSGFYNEATLKSGTYLLLFNTFVALSEYMIGTDRPYGGGNPVYPGLTMFDTSINKAVWYNGQRYLDALGNYADARCGGIWSQRPTNGQYLKEGFCYMLDDGNSHHFPIFAHIDIEETLGDNPATTYTISWYKADGTQYTGQ